MTKTRLQAANNISTKVALGWTYWWKL